MRHSGLIRFLSVLTALGLMAAACGGEADDVAETDAEENSEVGADDDIEERDDADDADRETVTISLVTSFPEGAVEHEGFWLYEENLQEAAPWIEFDYRGGQEVFPQDQIGEAVETGAIDAATLPPVYYLQNAPFVHAMNLTPYTPMEERDLGVHDLYDEWHRETINAVWLGKVMANAPFQLYLNEPIDEADLSGFQLRTSPTYVGLVEALDGSPVDMPGSDLYTALERGVVDGYAWTSVGILANSWEEVTEYEVVPGFYETILGVIINQDFWESLDEETREVMTEVMVQTEAEVVDLYGQIEQDERAERADAGVELIELSDEEGERLVETANEEGWAVALDLDPDRAQQLRDIFDN